MLTDEKKKRIESLTTEEMLYEINLGRISRFQRESFAYLKTCYQQRITKDAYKQKLEIAQIESSKIPQPTPQPSANKSKNKLDWHNSILGKICIDLIIIILGFMAIWVLNHYFNLGL